MWYYKGKEITVEDIDEKYVGFVYVITNTTNGRKYIGQKQLGSKVKQTMVKRDKNGVIVKGKDGKSIKVTKRVHKMSDWQTYYGSNTYINEEIKQSGTNIFKREILMFCEGKALMNLVETYLQLKYNVLFDDTYYNGIVNCRISCSQLQRFDANIMNDIKNINIT